MKGISPFLGFHSTFRVCALPSLSRAMISAQWFAVQMAASMPPEETWVLV